MFTRLLSWLPKRTIYADKHTHFLLWLILTFSLHSMFLFQSKTFNHTIDFQFDIVLYHRKWIFTPTSTTMDYHLIHSMRSNSRLFVYLFILSSFFYFHHFYLSLVHSVCFNFFRLFFFFFCILLILFEFVHISFHCS